MIGSGWTRSTFGIVALAVLATPLTVVARQERPVAGSAPRATEIRITGKAVTLPIVMVGEFPFLEASIAGVSGKLMLDTGIEGALTINDHRVPALSGEVIGTRFAGSGQAFPARLISRVGPIRVASLRFQGATFVEAQDARQLEGITPDFIGWLGFRAFADSAMELDFKRSQVTFHGGPSASYLRGERIVSDLPFTTRRLPNHPILPGRIGRMTVLTTWDTGQNGALYIDEAGKDRLLRQGHLRPSPSTPGTYDLYGLRLRGREMPALRAIDVASTPSRSSVAIGITEPVMLSIGYALLRNFKSVWDFRKRRIYLLER